MGFLCSDDEVKGLEMFYNENFMYFHGKFPLRELKHPQIEVLVTICNLPTRHYRWMSQRLL